MTPQDLLQAILAVIFVWEVLRVLLPLPGALEPLLVAVVATAAVLHPDPWVPVAAVAGGAGLVVRLVRRADAGARVARTTRRVPNLPA